MPDRVPFVDLSRTNTLPPNLRDKIQEVIASNQFVKGEQVEEFSEKWAETVGAEYCVPTSSGSDALEIALKAHGIGEGDLVGVPAMTFRATAEAVVNVGAAPFFLDVDRDTALMDMDNLFGAAPELDAVIPVDLYGQPVPAIEIQKYAERYSLTVIEDAAQAHDAMYSWAEFDGEFTVGSASWTSTWSFFPTKNLGAFGDAGAITTQDLEVAERAKALTNHGRSQNIQHPMVGRNARMDELQAAVLLAKLPYLGTYRAEREGLAFKYDSMISNADIPACPLPNSAAFNSAWHLYPVLVHKPAGQVKHEMAARGIGVGRHYADNLAELPEFEEYPAIPSDGTRCPTAQFWADHQITLPLYPGLEKDQQELVVEALGEVL